VADLKPLISFWSIASWKSINLLANKCYAFIKRRGYVIPNVRVAVHDVLRHRIGITYEAEAENITSVDIMSN
jgi:MoxR-like ATPase